jgi:hypothetical protein
MNIQRKTILREVEIIDIEDGACFLYGGHEIYVKLADKYNTDNLYPISGARLKDGLTNRFMKTAKVNPVGVTVIVEY